MSRYSVTGCDVQQVLAAGGKDIKVSKRLSVVFAELTPSQANRLKEVGCEVEKMGGIKAVVLPPTPIQATPSYSVIQLAFAAGLDDMRNLFDPPLYGQGFNVAVLDTGIRESHEMLEGKIVYRENFTSDPMRDGFNHGTGVSSIIATVAPECGILNMKVLNDRGQGTEEEVILAIDRCIDLHEEEQTYAPGVINLSLGVPDDGNPNSLIRRACRAAIDEGMWVFAAAGNSGPSENTVLSPACEKYVVAIGSVGYEPFDVSLFSSRGPTDEGYTKPDAVMFGEDVVVASSTGDTATVAKSGTSFSTPFASGMAALYFEGAYKAAIAKQQLVQLPPAEITWVTVQDLIDVYLPLICTKPETAPMSKDDEYGYGMPYGPFAAQAIGAAPGVLGISSIIPMFMVMGVVGTMSKIMGGNNGRH